MGTRSGCATPAAGEITLKRGGLRQNFRLRAIADADKPRYLKEYLGRFKTTVQRYFPVQAGSPPEAFVGIAANYPVYELVAK